MSNYKIEYKLKELKDLNGFTWSEFAKKLGVSRRALVYANSTNKCSGFLMTKLLEFGFEISDIMEVKDE